MKHLRLLVALLALLTGVDNLCAQTTWTGVSEITSGEEYYIVNDATGLFLTPGNNWGTRATLDESPAGTATVTLADGKYTIVFTWPSGGNGLFVDSDDGNNIFCDRNNQANYFWTIDSNGDNTFTLQLASDQARYKEGSYLTAESRDIWANVQYNSSNENLRKWRFISPTEVKETMLNSEESLDVSLFVHGAQGTNNIAASNNSFDRFKERYSWNIVGGNWKGQNNQTLEGFKKYWMEAWNGQALTNRSATKTINDMPEGHYKVSAYTVGGNGVDWFAQVGSAEKVTKTTAGGNPALTSVELDVTETSNITLGIQSSSNTTVGWIAFDNVKLEYTSFKKNYTEKLAEAEALAESLSGKVPTAVLDALQTTINDNKNKTSEYLEAAAALTSAMETANSFVAPYARYISVRDAVLAINAEIDLSTANSQANAATTTEAIDVAVATARTALADYLPNAQLGQGETIDLTAALIDNAAPGESGNVLYWDASGNVGYGSNLCEYYGQEGATIKQAITILPKGNFKLTAIGFTRTGYKAELFAGENSTNIATVASSEVNSLTAGDTWINNGNGVTNLVFNLANLTEGLEIGLKADTQGDKWMVWRSFRLVYGDVFEPYTLVEGKMNAGVATAQSTAENNYKTNPSPATYQALMDAIANAQASAKAYEDMTTAVTKIDAALEAATSATVSADAYNTIKSAYNEGTIADADIMTKVAAAYDAVIPVIKSQTAAQADFTLAIQNQSFEYGDMTGWTAASSSDTGVREASNATYSATGSDGKYLFNTWWQGVPLTQAVADLPNGEYTLTVSVASDGATIYLLANGEHNEGIETYATTNAEQGQYSKDTFQDATFTFLVKDGNATIGVVGGADGTAGEHKDYVEAGYWWYKADNFRLVKNRELTEEEMAVIPTGITLDGTATIFKGKTLQLTPAFAPEDATQTVTWASDNEGVATVSAEGVVTAVAYGTANITVTSTLNAEATSTCAVTVTAPLITEAENLDFAEGPVIENHITTYAKDMSANNTTYSQMQLVNGWTFGTDNGDARAAGIMAYGSSYGMGASTNTFFAPSTNPGGESTGNALGMVGVWGSTVQYIQNVKIPAGAYTITVPVYRNGGATALTKNLIGVVLDDGTEHFASTTSYKANEWTTETIKFNITKDTYGKLSVGLNAPNKGSADCQRLWIDGINITFEPFATADEIAALNNAIEAAEAKSLGFDEGEFAPYKNIEALKTLSSAKALDVENPIAQSDVTSVTEILTNDWTANDEEVDAIFDGQFATTEPLSESGKVVLPGWTKVDGIRLLVKDETIDPGLAYTDGKAAVFSWGGTTLTYGEQEGYTLPMNKNSIYELTFKVAGWRDGDLPQSIKITLDGVEQNKNISVGRINETESNPFASVIFYVTPTADISKLTISTDKHFTIADLSMKLATNVEINEANNYDPTKLSGSAKQVTFKRTLVEGWNGLVLPFDMTVNEAKTVFNASAVKDFTGVTYDETKGATLVFSDATDIKAGKPFMIKATAGTEYTINNVELKVDELRTIEQTIDEVKYTMTGTYQKVDLTNVNFVLIQGNNYYQHNTNKQSSAKAFRAYFVNESTGEAASKGINFNFGDETNGISLIEDAQNSKNGNIYNLQGQKVNHAQKGVYIVNGKKVVVK